MRFDLDIKGDQKVVDNLDDLAHRASNLKPVFEAVANIFAAGIKHTWATKGAYIDKPWPQLAAATVERKAREGKSPEMLRATGVLQRSVLDNIYTRIATTQVRVGVQGSDQYRARFHQGGTSQGMPARPLVGIAKQDRKEIFRLVLNHFEIKQ